MIVMISFLNINHLAILKIKILSNFLRKIHFILIIF